MIKVILFVVLMLPGDEPLLRQHDQPSVEVCLENVAKILKTVAPKITEQGGAIQAACILESDIDTKKS